MKKIIITLFIASAFLGIGGCTRDPSNTNFQLPPETQTGANTFGVTINGKVYIPRDPPYSGYGSAPKGMDLWGASDYSWYEIEVKDGKSAYGFNLFIHMQPLASVGKIILKQSNFHNNYDSVPYSHIYFQIWSSNTNSYAYYGSIENQGEINITKLSGGILSGNFKGKFVRYDNPNDYIQINDGRFDINGFTLPNTIFP